MINLWERSWYESALEAMVSHFARLTQPLFGRIQMTRPRGGAFSKIEEKRSS